MRCQARGPIEPCGVDELESGYHLILHSGDDVTICVVEGFAVHFGLCGVSDDDQGFHLGWWWMQENLGAV